jgi:hypothetical protein
MLTIGDMTPLPRPPRSRGFLLGGIWLRCRVWARSGELDALLAAGEDPIQSDELSLRAGQLRSEKSRAQASRSLLATVQVADGTNPRAFPPPACRRSIRACRELLVDLAERVRDCEEPCVRGLASVSQLLHDGDGPLYFERARKSLRESLMMALVALDDPPTSAPPARRRDARG